MSGSEIILGLVALVLVVFSLVISLLIPRRDPGFPGRNLRVFVVVAALLVAAMLTAVEVLGEAHHREGGETGAVETGQTETGAAETGPTDTTQTESGAAGGAEGDPAAGKEVFASAGCGSCHTLADAGASGNIGPNLDDVLKGKDAEFVHTSIVDPNAEIAPGFQPGIMPQNYGDQLDEKQLADLVAYLLQATQG